MGVPKFYRWLSERYPCLSEVVKEHQIPEFDNLYLDMNGIIHNCSHPNDDDPHFRITEEKIFSDIFHYIEVLFRMIQPKKVFFMAIDGVAPRAKMNQQRGRRFRSAKEAELNEKRAKDRGEVLPSEARFDSNCITPGTPFMCRLNEQLKYFVTQKISTDSLWQDVTVILSGHETPGEGEHKIMDYIRHAKSKPDYDPNLRHCLYGLDADLMMLGLCTHDPHFSLLREEVRFTGKKNQGGSKRIVTPETTTFHLLHLSLLREYIDHEFGGYLNEPGVLDFGYNLESIIDDWILLGFLVGNDFLPHLPHLHINKGAFSELFSTYKRVLPTLGGYMNMNGQLHLDRFAKFLEALAEKELDRFEDIYSDAKWIEGKTAKKVGGSKAKVVSDTPGPAHVEELLGVEAVDQGWEVVSHQKKDSDLVRLLQSANDFLMDSSSEPTDQDDLSDPEMQDCSSLRGNMYQIEFRAHKREYYKEKLGYKNVTPEVLREQAEGYVLAIQWNLHYYYDGCVSWSWYYPHHFAPWITDIRDFANMSLSLEKGEPFLPFEQLLSVLPAASKDLLPPILQGLMLNPNSPILNYYPKDFECDLNGKQQEWEAVVLIPFIDQQELQNACSDLFRHMTQEEKNRNVHGPMMSYSYTKEPLGSYEAPQYFQTIERNFARSQEVWRSEWEVPIECLRKGLMEGVRLDVYFPGFPTLKHIPHKARLAKEAVKVFEQASRGENMMLTIEDQGNPDAQEVANELLGQEIWVAWPHMIEAMVSSVQNETHTYTRTKDGRTHVDRTEKEEFRKNAHVICEQYKTRYGIIVGDTRILLQANVISGRKYVCGKVGKITLEKIWSKTTQSFSLQTTRKDILTHDSSFTQYRTLPELYPDGSTCFVMAYSHYGCQAEVITIDKEHRGRIQLSVIEPMEPSMEGVKKLEKQIRQHYYPGYKAAQQLGISSHLLSRITGTMFVLKGPKEAEVDHAGKVNIGLNLKNNKKGEEVCGFTRKSHDNNWLYSSKAVEALRSYMSCWPEVFDYLCSSERINGDYFHAMDIFGTASQSIEGENSDKNDKLKEMSEWMRDQPFYNASRQPCGTLTIDENMVTAIEQTVSELSDSDPKRKKVVMQLRPHLIYKPSLFKGGGAADQDADYNLFDRVVNVRQGFSVPLGLRGTIIGVDKAPRLEDGFVEVLFDQEFHGGLPIRTSAKKCYRVPRTALINISHGNRLQTSLQGLPEGPSGQRTKPTAIVQPIDQTIVQPIDQTKRHSYSRIAKEGSPAVKHVTAPDPSCLPTPTDFLKSTEKAEPTSASRGKGPKSAPKVQNSNFDMNQLWDSLQQNNPPPPKPTAAGIDPGSSLNPNVQHFFAPPPKPPVAAIDLGSSINPNVQQFFAQAFPPQVDNVQQQEQQFPTTQPMGGNAGNANPFVPLQVSIKSSKPSKKRGGSGRLTGNGAQPVSSGRGRGGSSMVPPHQPRDTTNAPKTSASPTREARGQGQHKRTRAKLAANFSSSPSD